MEKEKRIGGERALSRLKSPAIHIREFRKLACLRSPSIYLITRGGGVSGPTGEKAELKPIFSKNMGLSARGEKKHDLSLNGVGATGREVILDKRDKNTHYSE